MVQLLFICGSETKDNNNINVQKALQGEGIFFTKKLLYMKLFQFHKENA